MSVGEASRSWEISRGTAWFYAAADVPHLDWRAESGGRCLAQRRARRRAMNTWSEHRVLNHLIETCRDGERGFRLASQQVADPGLKALFTELSAQRATFAAQLVPHVQRLGGQPASDGTATA